jgi:hypothetical protein
MNTDEAVKYLREHHGATHITKRILLEAKRHKEVGHVQINPRVFFFKASQLDRWIEKKTISI